MKKLYNILFLLACMIIIASCELDEVPNPNSPNVDEFVANPSKSDLVLLVAGLEARIRDGRGSYITATGSISRELYFFNSSDPATTATLIGKEGAALTGSEPQLTGFMSSKYSAIKSANLVIEGLANSTDASITTAEAAGFTAYANTMKAYALMEMLALLNNTGLRVEVADPDNLGPILSKDAAYDEIRSLLDGANTTLATAEFAFTLSPGFAGFNTPATFAEFNRALAARAALYDGDHAGALTALNDSFFDLAGALSTGPSRQYGLEGFEIVNPIFKAPQQSGDQYVVHNRLITGIRATDTRVSKFRMRADPVPRDGLNGTHEISLYASTSDPISHIRNEELILIYAEANINAATGSLTDAETALNVLNTAYNLTAYAGALNTTELTDELMYHRTYSLWAEGHAMFDLRRNNRLNDTFLPIDRAGDIIHTEFPLPQFDR